MSTKYERTHKKIIEYGMKLLSAGEYERVSIPMICKQLGISRPTFYVHFKSKEQMVSEYYSASFFLDSDMIEWISSAPDNWTAIVRMQLLYIRHSCNPDQAGLISRCLSYRLTEQQPEAVVKYNDLHQKMLFQYIKKAQEEGSVTNRSDPHYLCKSIFMLQTGNLYIWCTDNGAFDQFTSFFWNLESILCVSDPYRGMWKSEISFIPVFGEKS